MDGAAVAAPAQRLARQVHRHGTGQRIGHHQRRRGQIVGAGGRVHAAFEIAVAGKHGGHGQAALVDGVLHRLRQGAGIADAGGAAVSHQVETLGVQRLLQPGPGQIVAHRPAAGCQRGLHPGPGAKAAFQRLSGHQPGRQHDGGVGGVGAARDGGDGHRPVLQAPAAGQRRAAPFARRAPFPRQHLLEAGGDLGQRDAVLRAAGPRQAGLDLRQVQLHGVAEQRFRRAVPAPQALRPGIGLHQLHLLRRPPGEGQIAGGLLVDGEKAAGGAVFRGHVGDGGAVGQRQAVEAGAEELHERPTTPFCRSIWVRVSTRSVAVTALPGLPFQPAAGHRRHRHGDGLAQHRRLGLDAAHPPAQHGQRVHHGGMAVGADQGVGKGHTVLAPHHAGEVFQVDLMADAGAGRHHAQAVEGALGPAQEAIAFQVALHLQGRVTGEGAGAAEAVHLQRVVDHQIDMGERVDAPAVSPPRFHGVAHGGQVGDGGNAGKVLHQHPSRAEGDLLAARPPPAPAGDGADVVARHRVAVLVAQQVLQQDLQRNRQARKIAQAVAGGLQAEHGPGPAAGGERAAGIEAVEALHGRSSGKAAQRDSRHKRRWPGKAHKANRAGAAFACGLAAMGTSFAARRRRKAARGPPRLASPPAGGRRACGPPPRGTTAPIPDRAPRSRPPSLSPPPP